MVPNDAKSASVEMMVWFRTGHKALPETKDETVVVATTYAVEVWGMVKWLYATYNNIFLISYACTNLNNEVSGIK